MIMPSKLRSLTSSNVLIEGEQVLLRRIFRLVRARCAEVPAPPAAACCPAGGRAASPCRSSSASGSGPGSAAAGCPASLRASRSMTKMFSARQRLGRRQAVRYFDRHRSSSSCFVAAPDRGLRSGLPHVLNAARKAHQLGADARRRPAPSSFIWRWVVLDAGCRQQVRASATCVSIAAIFRRPMKSSAALRPPFTPKDTTPQEPPGRYFCAERIILVAGQAAVAAPTRRWSCCCKNSATACAVLTVALACAHAGSRGRAFR